MRDTGKIWYQAYDAIREDVSESSDVFTTVKELMSNIYGLDYSPVYILKVTWEKAPRYGSNNEVSDTSFVSLIFN
jgi:hypothetical protein